MGTNIPSLNIIPAPATYGWSYYEDINLLSTTYINGNDGAYCSYCTTDTTLNAMNQTAIYLVSLELNVLNPTLQSCGFDDTLSYNPVTNEWELYSNFGNETTVIQEHSTEEELLKVTDLLGRETKSTKNEVLFYIYDDRTLEKIIVME